MTHPSPFQTIISRLCMAVAGPGCLAVENIFSSSSSSGSSSLAGWQAAAGPGLPAPLGQRCSSNADAAAMLMQAAAAATAAPDTPLILLQETLHTCLCFSARGCNNPLEDIFSVGAGKMGSLAGHHNLLPGSQP